MMLFDWTIWNCSPGSTFPTSFSDFNLWRTAQGAWKQMKGVLNHAFILQLMCWWVSELVSVSMTFALNVILFCMSHWLWFLLSFPCHPSYFLVLQIIVCFASTSLSSLKIHWFKYMCFIWLARWGMMHKCQNLSQIRWRASNEFCFDLNIDFIWST